MTMNMKMEQKDTRQSIIYSRLSKQQISIEKPYKALRKTK